MNVATAPEIGVGIPSNNLPLKNQILYGIGSASELSFSGEIQQKTIEGFKKSGLLRISDDGDMICDLDRFRKIKYHELRPLLEPSLGQQTMLEYMHGALGDTAVYSEEDFIKKSKGENVSKRPLFYVPESAVAALDREKAHEASYYLGYWEVGNTTFDKYPTKDGSSLTTWEAVTTQLLYNKQFGDGVRADANSPLQVRFPGEDSYRPATWEFFKKHQYSGSPGAKDIQLSASPAVFFEKRCPEMIKRGLVVPEIDFRTQEQGEMSEVATIQHPSEFGQVSIGGNRYLLGRKEFGDPSLNVRRLARDWAVIYSNDGGVNRVKAAFFVGGTEPKGTQRQGDFTLYRGQEVFKHFPYLKDSSANFYIDQLQTLSREYGVPLIRYSVREQEQVVSYLHTAIRRPSRERMHAVTNICGSEGLASLAWLHEAGYNLNPDRIMGIPSLRAITQELAQVHKAVNSAQNIRLSLESSEQLGLDIYIASVQERSYSYIEAAKVLSEKKTPFTEADVVGLLAEFRRDVMSSMDNRWRVYGGTIASVAWMKGERVASDHGETRHVLEALSQRRSLARQQLEQEAIHFYQDNVRLYESLQQTTGDTGKEQDVYRKFHEWLSQQSLTVVDGDVIDAGTGVAGRMLPLLRETHDDNRIIGFDLVQPAQTQDRNTATFQASAARIPIANDSASEVTLFWSVFSDLTDEQVRGQFLSELQRTVKPGGIVYMGQPHLEGGENSWLSAAYEYHESHPDSPLGTIRTTIAGREKMFYILPQAVLDGYMYEAGFEPIWSLEWRTQVGKPRIDKAYQKRVS